MRPRNSPYLPLSVLGAGLAGALLAYTGYVGIGYLCLILTIASALIATLFRRQLGLRSE